jgi:hypothetical protein
MESKERFVIEIILSVVFIAILILGSIVVINASEGSKTETTITNSFNTYNYNYDSDLKTQPSTIKYTTIRDKPYIIDDDRYMMVYDNKKVIYNVNNEKVIKDYGAYNIDRESGRIYYINRADFYDNSPDYDAQAQLRIAEGFLGNDINNYEVYVTNREYTGEYFKVVFYFEDYSGNVDSKAITKYIGPREESMFVIKDVTPNKYENKRWWYKVILVN